MGAARRRADTPVERLLFEHGYEFEFFQAVRLLLRLEHRVRFKALQSLSFPPGPVYAIERHPRTETRAYVTVAFMGLTGPQGVLPAHYTQEVMDRLSDGDGALAAFLDLFNHRFVWLFYRAWEKHRFFVPYERQPENDAGAKTLTQYLSDLIGVGTRGLSGRLAVRDRSLLLYAGLIAQRPHSAAAIAAILRDYFGVPVEIQQFVGEWLPLRDAERSYLSPPGFRNRLGSGAIAGDAVWCQEAGFQIQIGPLRFTRYVRFLPGGDAYRELVSLTRFITGQAMSFEVQLILQAEDVPWCRLSDVGDDAPRLGWMGWLKTEQFVSDATDAVFAAVN